MTRQQYQDSQKMKFLRRIVFVVAVLFPAVQANAAELIGFFSPRSIFPELVPKTSFVMIKAYSVEQVRQSLALADNKPFLVHIDFDERLPDMKPARHLNMRYIAQDGKKRRKALAPLGEHKLRKLPSNRQIEARLQPYLPVLQAYKKNVGTLFLVDEPYLNGVSKKELERAGAHARKLLDAHGLNHVRLGVIFAGAMFNKEFAQRIDRAAGDYAATIDAYYRQPLAGLDAAGKKERKSWKAAVSANRLTTYDRAGNMHVGGGIPKGFDVVGFDFYLSTLLFDGLHENTLDWFSERYPAKCGNFKGKGMRELRRQLSFFRDGPVLQGTTHHETDRILLNAMFNCRMGATLDLLEREIAKSGQGNRQVLLISESSNNGVLEFDSAGNIEQGQPEKLNEMRVRDEVIRALELYRRSPARFSAGLMFFTYQNEYDYSIKLKIGGARDMPEVMRLIAPSK